MTACARRTAWRRMEFAGLTCSDEGTDLLLGPTAARAHILSSIDSVSLHEGPVELPAEPWAVGQDEQPVL